MTPMPRHFESLVLDGRLAGRTALITGGAGGMGRAASKMFARAGARVAILDIQEEAGEALVQEIERAGGEALFLPTDVSDTRAVRAAIARTIDAFGPIDTLFSHAGTIIVKPLHETTDEEYDRLMRINARSAFVVCREVVAHMLEHGGGSIVITSSIGGEKGFGLESVYCMTKGAAAATGALHRGGIPRPGHPRQRRLPCLRQDRPRVARDRGTRRVGPELGRRRSACRAGPHLRTRGGGGGRFVFSPPTRPASSTDWRFTSTMAGTQRDRAGTAVHQGELKRCARY